MTASLDDLLNTHLAIVAARTGRDRLDILETGCIRDTRDEYRGGDGWSTLTLATHAKNNSGSVTSVDLDTRAASEVLSAHGVEKNASLVTGYSIDVLAGYVADGREFDFILLDSDNDAQLILHEYYLALRLIRDGGIVMIDDVEPGSSDVVKGDLLIPHLERVNKPYVLLNRSKNAAVTGVAVVDF